MTCAICENELTAHSRLKLCAVCRQSVHSWMKRRPAEILQRSQNLRKYRARLASFATLHDDNVDLIDTSTLIAKRLIAKSQRKAKANVVEFKLRAKRRATR